GRSLLAAGSALGVFVGPVTSRQRQRPVVVAVVAVAVGQPAVGEGGEVGAVRDLLVAATLVGARAGHWRAGRRVGRAHLDHVLVVVPLVRVVQVAVVQVIDVPVVPHPLVSAVLVVNVLVAFVGLAAHDRSPCIWDGARTILRPG